MSHELTHTDREKMHRDTAAGIARGQKGADQEWRQMALECLRQICLTHTTFTVNDVRELVKRSPLTTADNRAMGGVIKTGERNAWMISTGETIPSVVGHKVPIQIWQSLIYRKGPVTPAPVPDSRWEVMVDGTCKIFSVSGSRLAEFNRLYPNARRLADPKPPKQETPRQKLLRENRARVAAFDRGEDPFAI